MQICHFWARHGMAQELGVPIAIDLVNIRKYFDLLSKYQCYHGDYGTDSHFQKGGKVNHHLVREDPLFFF